MPKNATQKKAIRDRMATTGEPYMEARRNIAPDTAVPEPTGAWIIQQGTTDPMDSTPYPWVLHEDRTTHGFIDHGYLIGVLTDPDDQSGLRAIPAPLTEESVRSMLGCYPVTRDRFTGSFGTWTHPIESMEPAAPASERTRLYGGLREDPRGSGAPGEFRGYERAALRAEADQRVNDDVARAERPDGSGRFVSELHFTDGLVLDVAYGGVTTAGLIDGFVTVDSPKALVKWDEVVQALDEEQSDLSRLVGMCLRVYPSDMEGPNQMTDPIISDVIIAEAQ